MAQSRAGWGMRVAALSSFLAAPPPPPAPALKAAAFWLGEAARRLSSRYSSVTVVTMASSPEGASLPVPTKVWRFAKRSSMNWPGRRGASPPVSDTEPLRAPNIWATRTFNLPMASAATTPTTPSVAPSMSTEPRA